MLRDDEECVCHMEAILGLRQAHVSQHLSVLREAGLVDVRRDGWNVYYRVIRPEIFAVIDSATKILASAGGEQATTDPLARRPRACNCPKCGPRKVAATAAIKSNGTP
ncbi:MAG: ArsR/SmtB family transcription factor [Anaerolineae bacterium]